jgi:hypothetical protein
LRVSLRNLRGHPQAFILLRPNAPLWGLSGLHIVRTDREWSQEGCGLMHPSFLGTVIMGRLFATGASVVACATCD